MLDSFRRKFCKIFKSILGKSIKLSNELFYDVLCARCRNPANALSGNLGSDQGIIGSNPYYKYCLCVLYGEKCIVALMTKARIQVLPFVISRCLYSQPSKPQFLFAKQNCWSRWYSYCKTARYILQVGRKYRFASSSGWRTIKPVKVWNTSRRIKIHPKWMG